MPERVDVDWLLILLRRFATVVDILKLNIAIFGSSFQRIIYVFFFSIFFAEKFLPDLYIRIFSLTEGIFR